MGVEIKKDIVDNSHLYHLDNIRLSLGDVEYRYGINIKLESTNKQLFSVTFHLSGLTLAIRQFAIGESRSLLAKKKQDPPPIWLIFFFFFFFSGLPFSSLYPF